MKTIAFLIVLIGFMSLKAQIPNNGFELWTIVNGYTSPNGWGNLNVTTKSYSVYTCGKLSPGNPGNSYLAVISKSITGKGVVPGRVVLGKIDTVTYKPISGFSFSTRPVSLSYNMQYMVSLPSDTAYVSVTLSKWNNLLMKRDTIAFGKSIFNAMAHSWFTNYTYLNYISGENPDSACIVISASSNNPLNNSFMYIDNLQFNGSVIGIDERNLSANDVILYPNPSKDIVTINITQPILSPIQINIYDNAGRLVFDKIIKENKTVIDVSALAKGTYFFEIKQNKTLIKKLILN
jgi:hypothetical protein